MKDNLLEVGDVLYKYIDGKPSEANTVTRVTNTQAELAGGIKVRRELRSYRTTPSEDDWHTKEIGSFARYYWYLKSPSIERAFQVWNMRRELEIIISTTLWRELPDEKVEPLLTAMKSVLQPANPSQG